MNRENITDDDRYPTLSEEGRRLIRFLREHTAAPIYRNESGNRLTSEDVQRVRRFEREVLESDLARRPAEHPAWLTEFVERCFDRVPYYRRYGSPPERFEDLPTTSRADLSRDIAAFVPDDLPLDRIINFSTSGTTGHPLLLPSHPSVAASYLAFHKRALRSVGIELSAGRGEVGVVLIGFQRECFSYVSVTPSMGESGFAKINLHPSDWHDPADRARYLDALAPEVYAGDPISHSVLVDLPLSTRPRALLSTSMTLLPALRGKLEQRFGCPVVDLYSLNEAGPVAFDAGGGRGHELLQHCLVVETVDPAGRPLPPGERGEVTLTGGFNPYLPLLRYRTGDWAGLRFDGPAPQLVDLAGRPPVLFRVMTGEWINNIEVTFALRRFVLAQYTLHQHGDGALTLSLLHRQADPREVSDALVSLFGAGQPIRVETVPSFEGKVVQYTTSLAHPAGPGP